MTVVATMWVITQFSKDRNSSQKVEGRKLELSRAINYLALQRDIKIRRIGVFGGSIKIKAISIKKITINNFFYPRQGFQVHQLKKNED